MTSSAPAPAALQLRNWAAWLDKMPVGPARQHVKGEVSAPPGGGIARLTRAASPRDKADILVLDLTLEPKAGAPPPTLAWLEARYDEDPAKADYRQVELRWQGQVVQRLTVEVVH